MWINELQKGTSLPGSSHHSLAVCCPFIILGLIAGVRVLLFRRPTCSYSGFVKRRVYEVLQAETLSQERSACVDLSVKVTS